MILAIRASANGNRQVWLVAAKITTNGSMCSYRGYLIKYGSTFMSKPNLLSVCFVSRRVEAIKRRSHADLLDKKGTKRVLVTCMSVYDEPTL